VLLFKIWGDDIAEFLKTIIAQDTDTPDEYKEITRLVVHCPECDRTADENFIPNCARNLLTLKGPKVALKGDFPM
jgi:hypothetical protein